ncbi:hypothetical protein SNEBB_002796 [Seison nebaliae]|nr:hypothetical protein SNEBB_002796 [Seison nebaliae]
MFRGTTTGTSIARPASRLKHVDVPIDHRLLPNKTKRLQDLVDATRFSRQEVQCLYRGFKQDCPSGVVNEDGFKDILSQFFPQGNSSKYAHKVFKTIDLDGDGTVTFEEFIKTLSILTDDNMEEKLKWTFTLYDTNNDGLISRQELRKMIESVYDMMGPSTKPPVDDNLIHKHSEDIYERMNLHHSAEGITLEDFIQYCLTDEIVNNSLNMLDTYM